MFPHFGYTGQYQDDESGLVYLRARYYDPSSQQFLSRDPAVQSTGQPYGYAGGNPTNVVDPAGLWPGSDGQQLPPKGTAEEQSNGTWIQPSLPGFEGVFDLMGRVGAGINAAGWDSTGLGAGQTVPIRDRPAGRSRPHYDSANGRGVYVGKDRAGDVRYVGQGDAPGRASDHSTSKNSAVRSSGENLRQVIVASNNLTASEAQGLEELLITYYGGSKSRGGTLLNRDSAIRLRNTNRWQMLQAAAPLFMDAINIIDNSR